MEELAISQEKLEGFLRETAGIRESLLAAAQNCHKIYEKLLSDAGTGSISAVMSYRGSSTEDLLAYYENLLVHLIKLEGLFGTGSDYLMHCRQTAQNADDRIAEEVTKR